MQKFLYATHQERELRVFEIARFFSVKYLSDLREKSRLEWIWLPFWVKYAGCRFSVKLFNQKHFVNAEELGESVFPPEYDVPNTARFRGFCPLFWCWRHLWSLWKMAYLIHADRQPTKQTEGVLVFIKFSSQQLTWNCVPRLLMKLAWEGGKNLILRRRQLLLRWGRGRNSCPLSF